EEGPELLIGAPGVLVGQDPDVARLARPGQDGLERTGRPKASEVVDHVLRHAAAEMTVQLNLPRPSRGTSAITARGLNPRRPGRNRGPGLPGRAGEGPVGPGRPLHCVLLL